MGGLVGDAGEQEGLTDLVGQVVFLGEDQGLLPAVAGQDDLQRPQLGRGGGGDTGRFAVSPHGPAARFAAGGAPDELRPARQVAQVDALGLHEGVAHLERLAVSGPLGRGQGHPDFLDAVVGQHTALEFRGFFAVHQRPHVLVQELLAPIAALEQSSEPQPVRGQGVGGDGAIEVGGQVMHLVEDQAAVAIAQPLGMDGRAVVGGHRQVEDLVLAIADEAHRQIRESGAQLRVPLMHQHPGGHDHQRRAACPGEG